MRGAVMHGPGEVRVEEREAPQIVEPTDAIIRVSAACVCGSDLWPYRGIGVEDSMWPMPMGHEYAGVVEEVGDAVTTVTPGQFVVGSFWASDNTCEICRAGYQSACVNRVPMGALGAQADLLRVPLADGTLIATPDIPSDDLVPSLLSASDVLGTGWFGAVAAEAGPGKTVAVVGDGAVGLLAVLAAKQLGAERIVAMSRHDSRQRLARARCSWPPPPSSLKPIYTQSSSSFAPRPGPSPSPAPRTCHSPPCGVLTKLAAGASPGTLSSSHSPNAHSKASTSSSAVST